VRRFETDKLHGPVLLNVNVPDIPYDELQGLEVTRLGRRHKAEPVVKYKTPRGETVYWVGAAGPAQDAGEGTDFLAIQRNRVSVTPLQIDLTRYGQLDAVKEWLNSHALASTRS
jgi:5'-nucleotidase